MLLWSGKYCTFYNLYRRWLIITIMLIGFCMVHGTINERSVGLSHVWLSIVSSASIWYVWEQLYNMLDGYDYQYIMYKGCGWVADCLWVERKFNISVFQPEQLQQFCVKFDGLVGKLFPFQQMSGRVSENLSDWLL